MRLTPELVARVHRDVPDPGPESFPDIVWCNDADREAAIARVMAGAPSSGDVWVFAYGSLIWNPAFEFVERRNGIVRGWHRSFCLGWVRRFRGTPEQPGLMLALDRGGQCNGVAFRLPAEALDANMMRLFQREMLVLPEPMRSVWADVRTAEGIVRALVFVIDRKSHLYVSGLSQEKIADALAVAVGHRGSMAEYLYSTVRHLEDLGIRDSYLWNMQELVAERIAAAGAARAVVGERSPSAEAGQ
jgi:cation transport protein ChaC